MSTTNNMRKMITLMEIATGANPYTELEDSKQFEDHPTGKAAEARDMMRGTALAALKAWMTPLEYKNALAAEKEKMMAYELRKLQYHSELPVFQRWREKERLRKAEEEDAEAVGGVQTGYWSNPPEELTK